jgi:endonuclease/exonuclease/phosphatase family protein
MRLVAWNCNMALHRKLSALLALRPDVAVLSECASPERLAERLGAGVLDGAPVWIGANRDKGLAVLAFNGYRARLADDLYRRSLRFIAPVRIEGPTSFNLLAVWAQNFSDGIRRKRQPGPLRLALTRHYREFLGTGPAIVAGDFNNNIFWDKPGYLINHSHTVSLLERYGLVSAYHHARGEAQGEETEPTHYWRDRKKDGPTYHIDYVFLPRAWAADMREMSVGSFEHWCGARLSDHVPLAVDIVPKEERITTEDTESTEQAV